MALGAPSYPERKPEGDDWAEHEPPLLVPVPARLEQPLAGKRVVLHDPGLPAWRYDLIAAEDVDASNLVGVLDQHDYHRGQRDHVAIELASVSIDRLWVEQPYDTWDEVPEDLRPPTVDVPLQQTHIPPTAWLEHPIQPPIRQMRAGNHVGRNLTVGARAALRRPIGLQWGLRVISAPFLHNYGTPNLSAWVDDINTPWYQQSVTVCDEPEWFAWAATGQTPPSSRVLPLGAILLE